MKSKILLIVTILLVVGAALTTFFLIDTASTNKELTEENESLTSSLNTTETELDDSIKMAEDLTEENALLTEEKASLTDTLESLLSDKDDLQAEIEDLQANYDELLEFTFCSADDYEPLSVSYTSNDSVMNTLADWTADYHGSPIIDGGWVGLDFDSDTAYHYMETNVDYEAFIVFFDDSGAGTVNGVFFVRGQCWLSLPSYEPAG